MNKYTIDKSTPHTDQQQTPATSLQKQLNLMTTSHPIASKLYIIKLPVISGHQACALTALFA